MTNSDDKYTLTLTDDRTRIRLTGRGEDASVSVGDRDPETAIELAAETLRGLGRTVEIVRV